MLFRFCYVSFFLNILLNLFLFCLEIPKLFLLFYRAYSVVSYRMKNNKKKHCRNQMRLNNYETSKKMKTKRILRSIKRDLKSLEHMRKKCLKNLILTGHRRYKRYGEVADNLPDEYE